MNTLLSRIFQFSPIISYGLIASQYLRLWIKPGSTDNDRIADYSILILVEFIMMHSAVFMAAFSKSVVAWIALAVFYGLFILVFNRMLLHTSILWMYLFTLLVRLPVPIPYITTTSDWKIQLLESFGKAMLYILLLMLCFLGEKWIPKLGINKSFLSQHPI